jgi:hypothetical protein
MALAPRQVFSAAVACGAGGEWKAGSRETEEAATKPRHGQRSGSLAPMRFRTID